jgi:hypothetical protein
MFNDRDAQCGRRRAVIEALACLGRLRRGRVLRHGGVVSLVAAAAVTSGCSEHRPVRAPVRTPTNAVPTLTPRPAPTGHYRILGEAVVPMDGSRPGDLHFRVDRALPLNHGSGWPAAGGAVNGAFELHSVRVEGRPARHCYRGIIQSKGAPSPEHAGETLEMTLTVLHAAHAAHAPVRLVPAAHWSLTAACH